MAKLFPPPVHDMLALGHARMLEYQDRDYADLYVQRLWQVLQAEQLVDPAAAQGYATTREMARWLALWMAFDDIVRVADLKSSASRWQRVHGEVKAGAGDLLQVYDHFKPGVPGGTDRYELRRQPLELLRRFQSSRLESRLRRW